MVLYYALEIKSRVPTTPMQSIHRHYCRNLVYSNSFLLIYWHPWLPYFVTGYRSICCFCGYFLLCILSTGCHLRSSSVLLSGRFRLYSNHVILILDSNNCPVRIIICYNHSPSCIRTSFNLSITSLPEVSAAESTNPNTESHVRINFCLAK